MRDTFTPGGAGSRALTRNSRSGGLVGAAARRSFRTQRPGARQPWTRVPCSHSEPCEGDARMVYRAEFRNFRAVTAIALLLVALASIAAALGRAMGPVLIAAA